MRTLLVSGSDLLARGLVVSPEPEQALRGVVGAVLEGLSYKTPDRAAAFVAPDADEALVALLAAQGIRVVADPDPANAIAATCRAALAAGDDVVVVGSDKRFAQLVSDRVWWLDGFKRVRYTPPIVRKRFGVPPEQVADWLALVGDEGTLKGVKGIGAKGAVDLLEAHGSLDAALADPDAVEGRSGKALRAGVAEARAQQRIAWLVGTEAPVPLEELAYVRPSIAALNAAYADAGFYSLLQPDPDEPAPSYATCDTPEAVEVALASLGDRVTALHPWLEGSPPRGVLRGLAVSGRAGEAFFVPVDRLGAEPLRAWLEDQARPKVGHEALAVVAAFARLGVTVRGVVGDTAIASHLLDPAGRAPHDLAPVARARLRRPVPEPSSPDATTCCALADTVGSLWRSFAPAVPGEALAEALALCETLVRMELRGMLVDLDRLAEVGADFQASMDRIEAEIHRLVGHPFLLSSTQQLGAVLFEELGLPVLSRTRTGYSTASDVLERLVEHHPVIAPVLAWRRLQRLRDGWVASLPKHVDPDGRLRATFHPARSFSGRLVATEPDLGRVPGRTEEMARIRRAFVAPEGFALLSVDYQQLGLYVLAHLSGDPALVGPLTRGDDLHRITASAVLGLPIDAIDDDQRQLGKVVNFATFAGQGPSALAQQLGVSAQQAREWIERFDAHYAGVRAFQDAELERVRADGFTTTLAGRVWRVGGLGSGDPMLRAYAERMARRAALEGSVADVSRRGLLRADQALRAAGLDATPLVQVHDEVLFEVATPSLETAASVAADAMRTAFALAVPLRVGVEAGPNWADLSPIH
ncbi:MAG: hypothetical protein H6735_20535 [Alphaproteobacteria bacterium]|nr:hypothetical protein [Alphaproteobacteria bacterium]